MIPAGMPVLDPELRLLTLCTRLRPSEGERSQISSLIASPLDWDLFLEQALLHGVASLAFRGLSEISSPLPQAVDACLRDHARAGAARSLLWTNELLQLHAMFASQGIAVIPYKGPALSAFIYADAAVREFGDLDVLLQPKDFPAARAALCARGYKAEHQAPTGQEAQYLETVSECEFFHSASSMRVDVHWSIAPRHLGLRIPPDWFWSDLASVTLQDTLLPTLQAERLVLALCVHGAKHAWERLQWLCDLANLLRSRPALDWVGIEADAERFGARRVLSLGLTLASTLLAAPCPAHLTADSSIQELSRKCVEMIQNARPGGSDAKRWPILLRLRVGWWNRLRAIHDFMFEPGAAHAGRPSQRLIHPFQKLSRVLTVLLRSSRTP